MAKAEGKYFQFTGEDQINSDFLETASEENAITYWYSFFEKEKMWIPIKFTIDTPLGALVIKAKEIKDNYIG